MKALLYLSGMMCLSLLPFALQAQNSTPITTIGMTYDGDTIPQFILKELQVNPVPTFESRRFARKYWRLVHRVKKTYPYAQKAAELMANYSEVYELSKVRDSERRKYVKMMETELIETYGDELRKMSISDGRILIKLIDRETQNTSYELIKELRGGTSAFFWQGIARIFGNNLKSEFNPDDNFEDEHIDQILLFMKYDMI
ncbi:MAG: DUF4294 domain-containing protein [Mangrovibacterium sp.]